MTVKTDEPVIVLPWYRQFWPWMIIAIPASAVIMGVITLYLAITRQDALVKDDWYKSGKAINQELQRDQLAVDKGLKASVRIDDLSGEIFVELQPDQPKLQEIRLSFYHPTIAAKDLTITLPRVSPDSSNYRAELAQQLSGRRNVVIEPLTSDGKPLPSADNWRLFGNNRFLSSEIKLP